MIFWFFVPPTRADFSVEKRKRSFFHSHFHLMGKTVFWIWYPGYPDLISWIRGQHNIFIFRAKNKKVLPGGRGLAESTPARVLCVEFRQEVAFWQPLGWWREPTQRGRQSPRLETARPQMVSLSGQSSAPPPTAYPPGLCLYGKNTEISWGHTNFYEFPLICRKRNVTDETKTIFTTRSVLLVSAGDYVN